VIRGGLTARPNGSRVSDAPDDDREESEADVSGWKAAIREKGKIKVNGETTLDNEAGVKVSGSVEGSDPTSIDEASRERLTATGVDESGQANTAEDVDQYVDERERTNIGTDVGDASAAGLFEQVKTAVDEHAEAIAAVGAGIGAVVALQGDSDG